MRTARARFWLIAGAALVTAPLAVAQSNELPPDVMLLARIKVRAAQTLERLPNYTCVQTIERSRRRLPARKFELVDTVRMEVALVDGKEMFAWPGASKFEETDLRNMVSSGAIGNGTFALLARAVFLTHGPTFHYIGDTSLGGRPAIRYDFRVPLTASGYRVRVQDKEATVGYHGSFWVVPTSLELLRLEVFADDIPPFLQLQAVSDRIDYASLRIGTGDFLLPVSSELVMTDNAGNESRNTVAFRNCRQYTGESVLTFSDPPPDTAPPVQSPSEVQLPDGLFLEFALVTPIDSAKSVVGDPVETVLEHDVKYHHKIVVPKGAVGKARITRMERQKEWYVIGIQLTRIEFPGTWAQVRARLEQVGDQHLGTTLGSPSPATRTPTAIGRVSLLEDTPNGTVFSVRAARVEMRRGFHLVWVTQSASSEEKQ